MNTSLFKIVFLLFIGLVAWLTLGRAIADFNNQLPGLLLPLVGCAFLAIPAFRTRATQLFDLAASPSRRARRITCFAIFILAAIYLFLTALHQRRYLGPVWHDEFSYLTQTQMLAHGRLWMPSHPLADFFDSFYLINSPVYASMYFPGTALLNLPAVWLHLPTWLIPLLSTAAVIALTYRIIAQLIDARPALVAALLMLSLTSLRMLSTMLMSQIPTLLFGLLAIWALLHWRQTHKHGWAMLLGVFTGWLAITRPLDAIAFAVPLAIGLLPLPQGEGRGEGFPGRLTAICLIFLAAAPFLAIQLLANRAITGHFSKTPWQLYVDRDLPQTSLGFRKFNKDLRPISQLPQKQSFYDMNVPALLKDHYPASLPEIWLHRRLPILINATLPKSILIILIPLGLVRSFSRRRWLLASVPLLFVAFYSLSVFFLDYYPVVVAPSVIFLALLGAESLAIAAPAYKTLRASLLILVALVGISALPEFDRQIRDQKFTPRILPAVEQWERTFPPGRAILLFRFDPQRRLDEEPVYNATVPWPDDARIIRAHDLGPRNRELFAYYARQQPDRIVYLFDEADNSIYYLGPVTALIANSP